ncbi:hypothetical protein BDR04DRAFT_757554 [Suillus decipiens]|nr:hypothetical protein BDR04DRAFT_757554 [Suillus decipiens]
MLFDTQALASIRLAQVKPAPACLSILALTLIRLVYLKIPIIFLMCVSIILFIITPSIPYCNISCCVLKLAPASVTPPYNMPPETYFPSSLPQLRPSRTNTIRNDRPCDPLDFPATSALPPNCPFSWRRKWLIRAFTYEYMNARRNPSIYCHHYLNYVFFLFRLPATVSINFKEHLHHPAI